VGQDGHRFELLLASASPRRRQLLALLDAPFEARDPRVDESAVREPARAKALAASVAGATVLAADTRIRLNDAEIGKPRDPTEALAMLQRLAGREHEVVTDVAVVDGAARLLHFAVQTRVLMRGFDRAEAAAYVATGEPLDAAGGYKVQGSGGALVDAVEGCLANVVGLPLCHAYEALRRAGRSFPERPERVCQRHFAFTCPVWRRAQAQGRRVHEGATYRSWSDAAVSLTRPPARIGR
jgi:septum formation protein